MRHCNYKLRSAVYLAAAAAPAAAAPAGGQWTPARRLLARNLPVMTAQNNNDISMYKVVTVYLMDNEAVVHVIVHLPKCQPSHTLLTTPQ